MGPGLSTLRVRAVIFLQFDGGHELKTRPAAWVKVVLIWALDQIIAEVLVLVAVLVTLLIGKMAAVVQH